ncbi:MAG: HEAT repeat domain-containing protein [Anaerolineae bacterium]|nr:HEAT repeat domain-containing protein [Thermoflexales bacterium]MDW8406525.1 HEAT repeat domain-containing protein [Anaerolineae bacterium]
MSKKNLSLDETLRALAGETPIPSRVLKVLDRLTDAELDRLQATWPKLNDDRRAYIAAKLRLMARVDVRLDFGSIFRFLLSDVEPRVRLAAVKGLSEDESIELIDLFVILLRSDPSDAVRAAAATALGQYMLLGVMDKLSRRRTEQVYSALMGALLRSTETSRARRAALRALAYVSNDEVDLRIRDAYASDYLPLRISAVFSMGRSNDRRYQHVVLHELTSVAPAMRREAARAAGELELREAVPTLIQLIDDPTPEVRRAAVRALGQIGGEESKKALDAAARSKDPEIAGAAAKALAEHEFLYGDIKFSMGPFDELLDQRN